jgi:hypothetical protein
MTGFDFLLAFGVGVALACINPLLACICYLCWLAFETGKEWKGAVDGWREDFADLVRRFERA